jgi:uncharacterized protein YbcC (UPF0753/DUF2309 family)
MRTLIVVNLFLLLGACTSNQTEFMANKSIDPNRTIDSLLNQWHASASNADFVGYFDFMDSASVFIGTDAAENWTKEQFKTFSKPYFDKGKAWIFMAFERNIFFSQERTVVWFDELLDTWMGVCRGSGVLEYNDEKWKLKQYVLSVAIPNESMDEVISIKRSADSLFRAHYEQELSENLEQSEAHTSNLEQSKSDSCDYSH